jgi:hypothetical protein
VVEAPGRGYSSGQALLSSSLVMTPAGGGVLDADGHRDSPRPDLRDNEAFKVGNELDIADRQAPKVPGSGGR